MLNSSYVLKNRLSNSASESFINTGLPCGQTYGIDVPNNWSINERISVSFNRSPAFIAALHENDFAILSRASNFTRN